SLLMTRTHPLSPLFPYTTLFRSAYLVQCSSQLREISVGIRLYANDNQNRWPFFAFQVDTGNPYAGEISTHRLYWKEYGFNGPVRSEEHTSELQSRENLVCRLLLE